MRKYLILLLIIVTTLPVVAQNITNVRAFQEGNHIVLLYDLQQDSYVDQVTIDVNGKSKTLSSAFLVGDINKKIKSGKNKKIVYNILEDYANGIVADKVFFTISIQQKSTWSNSSSSMIYRYAYYDDQYVMQYLIKRDYNNVKMTDEIMQKMVAKISNVTSIVASEQNVLYVFSKSSLLYIGVGSTDLTEKIINKL